MITWKIESLGRTEDGELDGTMIVLWGDVLRVNHNLPLNAARDGIVGDIATHLEQEAPRAQLEAIEARREAARKVSRMDIAGLIGRAGEVDGR